MKVTGIEVDGVAYKVTKADSGKTYCEECDLSEKCARKDNEIFPCDMVEGEEIFVKHETHI